LLGIFSARAMPCLFAPRPQCDLAGIHVGRLCYLSLRTQYVFAVAYPQPMRHSAWPVDCSPLIALRPAIALPASSRIVEECRENKQIPHRVRFPSFAADLAGLGEACEDLRSLHASIWQPSRLGATPFRPFCGSHHSVTHFPRALS
jgi:hypothetical protein